jgi:hypothetical protein
MLGGLRRALGRTVGRALCFILETKLEIHFGASKIVEKIQIRYRWIRYEKYFNIRLNLEQKYKIYKIQILTYMSMWL